MSSQPAVTHDPISETEAIPFVRDIRKCDDEWGDYVILTGISIITPDEERAIEAIGWVREATSKIGDYRGLKVYVS